MPIKLFYGKKTIPSLLFFSLLLFLSGCGYKPTYELAPLKQKVSYDQITKTTDKGNVTVRCRICSREYVREVLGKQADALMGLRSNKRIVPIQIYIENSSDYIWSLSPYDVHAPLVDIEIVKSRFLKGATQKGLVSLGGYTALGLMCICVGTGASLLHPVAGVSIFGIGCSLLLTGPMISHNISANTGKQNACYEHVLDSLSLTDDIIIHPQEHISKLLFIEKKNMQQLLSIRLCDVRNNDHTLFYQLCADMPSHKKLHLR
jgi:hypothetical protein